MIIKGKSSITINATPEQTFAVAWDIDALPQWQPGLTETHINPPGHPEPGKQLTHIYRDGDQENRQVLWIDEHQPPSRAITRLVFGEGTMTVIHTYQSAPQGTIATKHYTVHYTSPRLAAPNPSLRMPLWKIWGRRHFRKEFARLNKSLKLRVEALHFNPKP